MPNISSVSEFLLLAFADTRDLQLLHFGLFLGIYLAALLGNGLILTAVACHHRLHTPMYFFLLNLALLDLGCISTTLPKAMANSLWDTRAISYEGCASQVFFFVFLIGAEYCLLTVMAYDHYVAICKPLHYGSLLGSRACAKMAAAAWGSGFLYAVLHTANTFSLPLCQGNAVDQFFCEIPQILKLSCSNAYLREAGVLIVSLCLAFACFVFISFSYVRIFRAVLRMPSEQGQHKAFSTCLPHLAVVSLTLSTAMVAYLKPPSNFSSSLDLVVSFLYSVVPPAVNPLIYSMRNQELKDALWKLFGCMLLHTIMFAYLKPPSISSLPLNLVSFLYLVVPPAVNPFIYSMTKKEIKNAIDRPKMVFRAVAWFTGYVSSHPVVASTIRDFALMALLIAAYVSQSWVTYVMASMARSTLQS
ncbi:olfactory receptor 14A16-like [Cygnus olor]|uniref:olfactory receptor 14A16-like n=1 Tax=Cygnus olor TaxID=8869 RepID=UPI001ADE3436|nr:olfactory receptor 14A16-like [Cygnus olor]